MAGRVVDEGGGPRMPPGGSVLSLRAPGGASGPAPKLAEAIARDMAAHIEERGWDAGVSLGSETSLRERFGGSRNTFREAVRILEQQGVARMRKGPGGGLVVTVPELGGQLPALPQRRLPAVGRHPDRA